MAFNLTTYGADTLLTWNLDVGDIAVRPTVIYVALHSADPTAAGNLNEIGAGVGYARQSITFDNPASEPQRLVYNTNILTFGPASGVGFSITHMTLWDAVSGGNPWWYSPITNKVVVAGDSYTILAGSIVVTFPLS